MWYRQQMYIRHVWRSILMSLAVIGLSTVMIERGTAHGGEDHGNEAALPSSTESAGSHLTVMKQEQFALGVLTKPVVKRDLLRTIELTGHIVPRTGAIASVMPPVGGRVVGSQLPRFGEHVVRGQVLFSVQQVLSSTERTSLRVEQIRAKSELVAAEQEVNRLERLEGVVAGKQTVEAQIRRDAAQQTYNALSEQLTGTTITVPVFAPITGEVVTVNVVAGGVVDGTTAVYEIADLEHVWVEADLFERDLPSLAAATTAEIRTPSYPGEVFAGTLYKIGSSVNPESRTITVLFDLANTDRRLKLNMSSSVSVVTSRAMSVCAVPRDAIVRSGTRTVVFVHTEPEHFEVRDVVPGAGEQGSEVEVVSGVHVGDRVVTSGVYQLQSAVGL